MTPTFNKVHNKFKLNGIHFSFIDLKEVAYSFVKEGDFYEQQIGQFLLHWQDNSPFIAINTSGSTGTPKTIKMSKQAMVNSAIATGDYFGLQPGDAALLCLPAHYIAGKMMLVRALILGLELDCIAPTAPLAIDLEKQYDFAAMVPMQLEQTISEISNIKNIIVGGAKVSNDLINKIQKIKPTIHETYGMTETVSHIAVKQINHLEKNKVPLFKVLPTVSITQDKRNCLVIEAPQLSKEKIITNDIVKWHSKNTFEWLGRIDHVINTGGIKVYPEQLESQLASKIQPRFFIASETDKILGEHIILIVEAEKGTVSPTVFNTVSKYMRPKYIYYINPFVETDSGKIQREKTLQLLKK